VIANWIDRFTGHGAINIYLAKSISGKIIWSLFLLLFIILNNYYMYNSLAEFFRYEVISNIKVLNEPELTFPALIICTWYSDVQIKNIIIYCSFNNKQCLSNNIELEPIVITGYGLSAQHDCIRINGLKVSEKNKKNLLIVDSNDAYESGLAIGLIIPNGVKFLIFIYKSKFLL